MPAAGVRGLREEAVMSGARGPVITSVRASGPNTFY